jgi:hypothetical protein
LASSRRRPLDLFNSPFVLTAANFTPESGHVRCISLCPLWAKSAIPFCRRTLFVGALSVTLAGRACSAPQVATDGCISPGCLRRTAAVEAPLDVKPAPPRPAKPKSQSATTAKTAKLAPVAAKPEKPLSPQTPAPAGASEEKAGSKPSSPPRPANRLQQRRRPQWGRRWTRLYRASPPKRPIPS